MVLSFTERVRMDVALGLGLGLLVLQLATGTTLLFAELTFVSTVFAVWAVNLAGGLRTIAGCCFAIVALKVFLIAEIAKVFYAEPGQSRLDEPTLTLGVIALSMAALAFAGLVCQPARPTSVLLNETSNPDLLKILALLSFVAGTGSFFASQFLGVTDDGAVRLGGLSGVLRRLSACAPLAIVAGTAFTIVTTRGKRLFSPYNAVPFCTQFAVGVLFTSKQALFDPFLYVIITGIAFRFTWRRLHLILGGLVILLTLFVLFPFGQVARNYTRGANIRETYQRTVDFFSENLRRPRFLIDQYKEYTESVEDDEENRYFEKPNGFLERLALLKPADALISSTLKQGQSGWETIGSGLADLLPRMILPRRFVNVPNELGFKAGFLDEDNFGTCVSFGFAADAFSSFGWPGVVVLSFVVGALLIVITRIITGPLEGNIWAVVLLGSYQIGIAEAHFGGVLQILIYQTAWTVAALLGLRLLAQFHARLFVRPEPGCDGLASTHPVSLT